MLKLLIIILLTMILLPHITLATNSPPAITPDPQIDKNMNRMADSLEDSVAILAAKGLAGQEMRIVITLYSPPDKKNGDLIREHAGVVTHRFTHALNGFAGKIPANKISDLARAWDNSLYLIEIDAEIKLMMDTTVPQTRARPLVWDLDNGYGLTGDPNTTIGILDTGVDITHPDLAGKLDFWYDFHDEQEPDPIDRHGHGTCVASIACGTGAVHGNEPLTSIVITDSWMMPYTGWTMPFSVPTIGDGTMTTTTTWLRNVNQACMEVGLAGGPMQGPNCYGSSPAFDIWNINNIGMHTARLGFPSGWGDYLYSVQLDFPYQQRDDGFNLMTGMAPNCRLALGKVMNWRGNGTGFASGFMAACDSFAATNSQINLKVANCSAGLYSAHIGLRSAADGLVNAGTVLTLAAGNAFHLGYPIGDPGQSPMAITVGAVDDLGRLAHYSCMGPAGSFKPDVVAPGGDWENDDFSLGLMVYAADSNLNECGGLTQDFPDQNPNDYFQNAGTSFSAPHVTGLAALVIQALESTGYVWNYTTADALLVKSIILMTATETNLPRNLGGVGNPPLNRGYKDSFEGYGMINADAAVEAVLLTLPHQATNTFITFGNEPADRRCWAAHLSTDYETVQIDVWMPPTLDADIYIYSPNIYTNGDPFLIASSCNPNEGEDESLTFTPTPGMQFYVTIKRISGYGDLTLRTPMSGVDENEIPQTRLVGNFPNPFNPRTTIKFNVGQKERVTIALYDLAGRQVTVLEDQVFEAGPQEVVWSGTDRAGKAVASGSYFVQLKTPHKEEKRKVMLIR